MAAPIGSELGASLAPCSPQRTLPERMHGNAWTNPDMVEDSDLEDEEEYGIGFHTPPRIACHEDAIRNTDSISRHATSFHEKSDCFEHIPC